MPRVLTPRPEPARRRPAAPDARAEDQRLALARRAGNQGLQRLLATRTRRLLRSPVEDAPKVAKVLLHGDDNRAIAEALELLNTANRIPFYKPVLALALTGNVLNPEGLKTAVNELYAKARDLKDKAGPIGMAHEILYALKLAESGVKVQMGGWKPDHLQKGMQELAAKVESLPAYLEDLAKQTVALGVGWGGDTVVWKPDIKGNASVTTIQHKVLTSPEEESFGRELINAAQQLAGDRQEKALPGGPRVASMRVASLMLTNDAHPLQSKPAGELAAKIKAELSHGYGAAALHTFVDRVEVTTTTTFFAFKVEAGAVTLESEAKSEAIKELKGLTPPTTKEKPAKQEAGAGSTAAMDEQKAYEAAVQARGKWVREQPDPEKAAIDKIVSGVAGKEKPEERRVAMKEAIATAREKSEDDALYLEAVLFARCGWVLYGDDESKARKAPEFQAKMKDMSVRLKKRTDDVNSGRKAGLEAKWAQTDPKRAAIIAAGDKLEDARKVLAERRAQGQDKVEWDELYDLRDTRLDEVALKLGNQPKIDADAAKPIEAEWVKLNDAKAKRIEVLESKLTAKHWSRESDSQPIKDAIARIVRVEAVPDYVGAVADAKAKVQKRERREARTQLADREKLSHPRLETVLKEAKIEAPIVREIFATVGEVKESEGNAREVARLVEELTTALAAAWKADPGRLDPALLLATTHGLSKVGAGITYVGLTAELNHAARVATEPDRKGIMIGQWYALEKSEEHPTWEAADTAVRTKQKEYKKQEVDVSFYEGDTLHIREVAANVEVLRAKLLEDTKLTQRTAYLQLQKDRKAKLTYVLDSDRDWRKIFDYGAGRGKKRLPAKEAPMVEFLVANNVTLVVGAATYDNAALVKEADTIRPAAAETKGDD